MKKNLWFVILIGSLLLSSGCLSNPSNMCNLNGAQNGVQYTTFHPNGQQVQGPKGLQVPTNGMVQVPCGGSAVSQHGQVLD